MVLPEYHRSDPHQQPGTAALAAVSRVVLAHPFFAAWCVAGLLLLPLSAWALQYADTWRPDRMMMASVFRTGAPTPLLVTPDATLAPERLARAAGLDPRQPFIVEWSGLLVAEERGVYRLRARVDDGVAMWVGDKLLIDRLSSPGEQQISAPVRLDPGLHPFRLRYSQHGGEALLRLSWALPAWREEFRPVYAIVQTDPPPLFRRIDKALRYPRQVAVAWSVWLLAALAGLGVWLVGRVAQRPVLQTLGWRELAAIVAVAVPLLGLNIGVGLYPWRGWAPDEIAPNDAILAASQRFSEGWFHLYPPAHFYVLGLVNWPVLLLARWNWFSVEDASIYEMVHAIDRSVTLVLAVLVLIAVTLLADRTVGSRARLLAPLSLLAVPLFAFYSKTSNVEMAYVFWFTVAAIAFVRAVSSRTRMDHVLLGASVAAAIATKDQAYGFFPGAALVLAWLAWRDTGNAAGVPAFARVLHTLLDTRLWLGLVTCLAVYSVLAGAWWNPDGVRSHVAIIVGQGSAPFRMFPATASGLIALTGTTLMLVGLVIGPLVGLAATLGLGAAVTAPATSAGALWLIAMPVSYVVMFIGVVGYVYDRFLLAIVVIVAIFAARGIDWGLGFITSERLRMAALAAVVMAFLYPAVALNVRIAGDSRIQAERWMAAHLTDDPLVLALGSPVYLPNLHPFQHRVMAEASAEQLLEWDPDVVVFNEDFFGRPGQPSESSVKQALAEAGYVESFVAERPAFGVLGGIASGLTIDPFYSNVGKLGATISIWVRTRTAAPVS